MTELLKKMMNHHIAYGYKCLGDLPRHEQVQLLACKIQQEPDFRRYEAIIEADKENTLASNFLSAMTGEITSEQFLTYLITNALNYYALDIDEGFEHLIEMREMPSIDNFCDEVYDNWRATR